MRRLVVAMAILVGLSTPLAYADMRPGGLPTAEEEAAIGAALACVMSLASSTGASELAKRGMTYTKNNGYQLPHLEMMNDLLASFEQNLGATALLCKGTSEEERANAIRTVIRAMRAEILKLVLSKRAVP